MPASFTSVFYKHAETISDERCDILVLVGVHVNSKGTFSRMSQSPKTAFGSVQVKSTTGKKCRTVAYQVPLYVQ